MTDAEAAEAAWTALLERFAHDLEAPAAEQTTWHPLDQPLPPRLAPVVQQLIERQAERMSLLRLGMAETGAHLAALHLVPAERSDGAAYIDRDA